MPYLAMLKNHSKNCWTLAR